MSHDIQTEPKSMTTLRQRLFQNSQSLNDLLYGQSPFQKKSTESSFSHSTESGPSCEDSKLQNGNISKIRLLFDKKQTSVNGRDVNSNTNSDSCQTFLKNSENLYANRNRKLFLNGGPDSNERNHESKVEGLHETSSNTRRKQINFQKNREMGTESSFGCTLDVQDESMETKTSPKVTPSISQTKDLESTQRLQTKKYNLHNSRENGTKLSVGGLKSAINRNDRQSEIKTSLSNVQKKRLLFNKSREKETESSFACALDDETLQRKTYAGIESASSASSIVNSQNISKTLDSLDKLNSNRVQVTKSMDLEDDLDNEICKITSKSICSVEEQKLKFKKPSKVKETKDTKLVPNDVLSQKLVSERKTVSSQLRTTKSVTEKLDKDNSIKSTTSRQVYPDHHNRFQPVQPEKNKINSKFLDHPTATGHGVMYESQVILAGCRSRSDDIQNVSQVFVHQNSVKSNKDNSILLSLNVEKENHQHLDSELADIEWRKHNISGRQKHPSAGSCSHSRSALISQHLLITPDLFIDDTAPDTSSHNMSELEKMIAKKYQQKRAASPHHRKQLHIIRRPQSVPAKGRVFYPHASTFDIGPLITPPDVKTPSVVSLGNTSEPIYMNTDLGNQRDVIQKPPRPNRRCYVKRNSKLNPEVISSSRSTNGFQTYKRDLDNSVVSERTSRKDQIKNIQRLFEVTSKDAATSMAKSPSSPKNQEEPSVNSLLKFESRSNSSINERQCLDKVSAKDINVSKISKQTSTKSLVNETNKQNHAQEIDKMSKTFNGKKQKFKNVLKHKKGKYHPSMEDLSNIKANYFHRKFTSLPNLPCDKDFHSNICNTLPNTPNKKYSLSVVDMGEIDKLDNMLTEKYFGNTEFDQLRRNKNKKVGVKSLEDMKKLFHSEPSISLKRSADDLKGSARISSATTEYHTSLVTGIVNDDTLSDINPDIFDSDAAGSTDNGLFSSSRSLNHDKELNRSTNSRSPFVHSSCSVPEPEIKKVTPRIDISLASDPGTTGIDRQECSESFTISDYGFSHQLSSRHYDDTTEIDETETEPQTRLLLSQPAKVQAPKVQTPTRDLEIRPPTSKSVDEENVDDITSISSLSSDQRSTACSIDQSRGFSVSESVTDCVTPNVNSESKSETLSEITEPPGVSNVCLDVFSRRLSFGTEHNSSSTLSLSKEQGRKIVLIDDKLIVTNNSEDIEMSTFSIQSNDSFDIIPTEKEVLRAKRKRLIKMDPVSSPVKNTSEQLYQNVCLAKTTNASNSLSSADSEHKEVRLDVKPPLPKTKVTNTNDHKSHYSVVTAASTVVNSNTTNSTSTQSKIVDACSQSDSHIPIYASVQSRGMAEDDHTDMVTGAMPIYASVNKLGKRKLSELSTKMSTSSAPFFTSVDSIELKELSPPYATVKECDYEVRAAVKNCAEDNLFISSPPYETVDSCKQMLTEFQSKSSDSLDQNNSITPLYSTVQDCQAEEVYSSVDECRQSTNKVISEGSYLAESFTHYESVADLKSGELFTNHKSILPNESTALSPKIALPQSSSQHSLYQTIDQVREEHTKSDSGIHIESCELESKSTNPDPTLNKDLYAKVGHYRKKSSGTEVISCQSSFDDGDVIVMSDDEQGPPLPARKYKNDSSLSLPKGDSSSKPSLLNKMGFIKSSTKSKFKSFRKAVSLERGLDNVDSMNTPTKTEKLEKSKTKMRKAPSLKSLTALFGKKSKSKKEKSENVLSVFDDSPDRMPIKNSNLSLSKKKLWSSAKNLEINNVEAPKMLRSIGKLIEICSDGSQIVELVKPPDGPIGFYIGRGTANYDYGIFVSRFFDESLEKLFSGLISVGDEILEINQSCVRDLSLDDVYELMADRSRLVLKIFPMASRRDL